MQEKVDLCGVLAIQRHGIGCQRSNNDAGTQRIGNGLIDQAGIEQILDDGRDAGNGQGITHELPPWRRAR